MADHLFSQRISRFNGGFEDTDGDFEIVSSLSKKQRTTVSFQHNDDIFTINDENPRNSNSVKTDTLFSIKILWSLATASIIVWLSWRWINGSHQQQQVKGNRNHEKAKPSTLPTLSPPKQNTAQTPTGESCSMKTSQAGHRRENLSTQFDKVFDKDAAMTRSDRAIATVQETIMIDRQNSLKTTFFQMEEVNDGLDAKPIVMETMVRIAKDNSPSMLAERERSEQESDCTQKRSVSPPPLADEPWFEPSPSVRQVDADSPVVEQTVSYQASVEISGTITPNATTNHKPGDVSCPVRTPPTANHQSVFDSQLAAAWPIHQSSFSAPMEKTPQRIALDYCQSFQIIEQELVRSGLKLDPARAAGELTMLHHSCRLQELQIQKEMSVELRRQSSQQIQKYENYLKKLSDYRELALNNIGKAFEYSILVCLLLEGSRQATWVKDELDYFSLPNVMEYVIQTACGCTNSFEENDESAPQKRSFMDPYITIVIDLLGKSLSPMVTATSYVRCFLRCMTVWGTFMAIHASLRYLHCPILLHQLLNGACLIMILAQSPETWDVVTRNLEVYTGWVVSLLILLSLMFGMSMMYHARVRRYLLERQHQAHKEQQQENTSNMDQTICQGWSMLAQMEDIALMLKFVPPLVMGMIVLCIFR